MAHVRWCVPLLAALCLAACDDTEGGLGLPSAYAVKAWPLKWCDEVDLGMTRGQIEDVMGDPTEEYMPQNTPEGLQPQAIWEAYGFHFTAFFDSEGNARQLDINTVDLTYQQQAAVTCDETRRN